MGRQVRVQFKTDVADDYLDRTEFPGEFSLVDCPFAYHVNCNNGVWTLAINISSDFPEDELIELHYHLSDEISVRPYKGCFFLKTEKKSQSHSGNKKSNRKKPLADDDEGKRELSIRPPTAVREEDWQNYDMTEKSALHIIHHEGNEWDFYYNADNVHLKTFLRDNQNANIELTEQRFSLALQFMSLAYIADTQSENDEIEKTVRLFSQGAAAAILPIIDGLSGDGED